MVTKLLYFHNSQAIHLINYIIIKKLAFITLHFLCLNSIITKILGNIIMHKAKLLLFLLSFMLLSCNSIKRGVDGAVYVSTAKPSFSIAVPNLPLRTSGQINAAITTSNALGGVQVNAWIAVYGGETREQPMAIISQASIKDPYYFDYNSIKFNSIDKQNTTLGKFKFQACTYLITNLAKDAFAALTPDFDHSNNANEPHIIVRRFSTRTDFETGKITLEYREIAPAGFDNIKELPFGAPTFLSEFNKRAEQAFDFSVQAYDAKNIKETYAKGIATRFLDENFFGSVSYHDPLD